MTLFPRQGGLGDARIENQLNLIQVTLYDLMREVQAIHVRLEQKETTDE